MFFFWVALAMADFNNLIRILAAAFFVKVRIFKASSDFLPGSDQPPIVPFSVQPEQILILRSLPSRCLPAMEQPSLLFWFFGLRNGHGRFELGRIPLTCVRPFPL